jgi:putative multiple sugar transport system substrate-binding protein
LAKVTVAMIDAIEGGHRPEINDDKTYDNGKKVVPSYLLTPVIVTRANWKPALVDSGYYTLDQLR